MDGEPWRIVPAEAALRAGLAPGRPLDRDRARALGRELRRARALTRALGSLAARDRSRRELDERLTHARVPAGAREEALAALARAGLVDDSRVAASRASALALRGYGDAAIRADLERRGLGPELVRQALADLEPERERARRILGSGGLDARAVRRLSARGFDAGTIAELGAFADEG